MGLVIVNFEARRDSSGNIKVYNLPADDGGGKYEVAGINDKYDHAECLKLVSMIHAGKAKEAEAEAASYIVGNTDVAQSWLASFNAGLEFYLRDCVFNRGATGGAKILQIALGVTADGAVGAKTRAALASYSGDLLSALRTAREFYERHHVGYREDLWKGLVNRWENSLTVARKFQADYPA